MEKPLSERRRRRPRRRRSEISARRRRPRRPEPAPGGKGLSLSAPFLLSQQQREREPFSLYHWLVLSLSFSIAAKGACPRTPNLRPHPERAPRVVDGLHAGPPSGALFMHRQALSPRLFFPAYEISQTHHAPHTLASCRVSCAPFALSFPPSSTLALFIGAKACEVRPYLRRSSSLDRIFILRECPFPTFMGARSL